eukprot:TRINITY_DN5808_c0_g1_i1.p2 TRINITY_DN5808_c0_g1~~TRINITY_DN5808_c0_g1_i1.p2  ORF type:complete len:109 (-),score=27.24 TRINITY_DN5808_c0_g1_i1:274-600(-)
MSKLLDAFVGAFRGLAPAYRAACGHRAYGLKYHDLLVETPQVVEAIRRLPPIEQEMRTRRLKIANDCCIKQVMLPPDQWTKPEEDTPYLKQYLAEVEQDFKDMEAFRT